MTTVNNDLDPIVSLDDRLISLLANRDRFSFGDARAVIPKEHASDITIYKAINRLENQRRIRYLTTSNRKKFYTTVGTSNLPVFRTRNGEDLRLRDLLNAITSDQVYDPKTKRWMPAELIESLPVELCYLFIYGQYEGTELSVGYTKVLKALTDIQLELTLLLEYIETVKKHPSMSGDMTAFKRVYGNDDPDMPTAEELLAFKRWLNTWKK